MNDGTGRKLVVQSAPFAFNIGALNEIEGCQNGADVIQTAFDRDLSLLALCCQIANEIVGSITELDWPLHTRFMFIYVPYGMLGPSWEEGI